VQPAVAVTEGNRSISLFSAVGRLAAGASVAQAAAEGTSAARSADRPTIAEAIFGKGGAVEVRVKTLLDELTERVRPALLVLAVGVGCILLICCANVANLLLSRGVARRRELAVRSAIGASRRRIVRQMVTESLALSGLGGAVGLGLCWALIEALPALAPADFPRLADVRLDGRTFAFAAAAALAAGLASGLLPALRAAGTGLSPVLREGGGASAGARTMRLGGGLLVVEAALAVVLLIGASLLLRSFSRLLQVDAGYDPGDVLVAQVHPPPGTSPQRTGALVEEVLERLRATPGVEAAGAGSLPPFTRGAAIMMFDLPDPGPQGETITARTLVHVVTAGYAEALSLRLREGRFFAAGDLRSGTRSVLVNDEFARSYLADGKPVVGRRWQRFGRADAVATEIIGVVGSVLKDGLDAKPEPELYTLPEYDNPMGWDFNLVVRSAGDPLPLVPEVRGLVRQLEPMASVEAATLASRRSASVGQPRFAAATLAAFALLALTLAATGLYGVLSYNVSQRRREIGVRSALGAPQGRLIGLVLRQGLLVTGGGLALGLAAAVGLTRLLTSLLFGVTPLDAVAFTTAPALLLGVALVACLAPARRAAAVEPTEALRSE
jgi:putative ABC transport system permease protein